MFKREQKLIFDAGPGYVGHQLMVPELYDYRTLEASGHGRMLTRQPDGVYSMSNVCRHRQAVMLEGAGNAKHIVCPVHRWTYDGEGQLIGAPHFPANPCLNLDKQRLENWKGLLFKGPRSANADLAGMQLAGEFNAVVTFVVEDGRIAPFSHLGPDRTAMGRFGNVMLTNGATDFTLAVRRREVVRLYLVNTANTRVFDVHLPGARMRLVGGDSGR